MRHSTHSTSSYLLSETEIAELVIISETSETVLIKRVRLTYGAKHRSVRLDNDYHAAHGACYPDSFAENFRTLR